MKFGITTVSIAPLYVEASSQSEMTSQLLFGELFTVLKENKNWLFISCTHDKHEAWISKKQAQLISKESYQEIENQNQVFTFDLVSTAISNREHIPLILGSTLPSFDGLSFKINQNKIIYNGQVLTPDFTHPDNSLIKKITFKYINSPFLWGGRSPFGIDAGGFCQMVYLFCGLHLPRTMQQQSKIGKTIHLIGESKPGDLLFFSSNTEINHVGILIDSFTIIHCDERVKVSSIDNHGIIDLNTQQYSHQLKSIKRLL